MAPIDQLSTITEESSQCSSVISVDVVPEVVITTSTRGHSPTVPPTTASFISRTGRRDGRESCSGQGHCCSCNRMRVRTKSSLLVNKKQSEWPLQLHLYSFVVMRDFGNGESADINHSMNRNRFRSMRRRSIGLYKRVLFG